MKYITGISSIPFSIILLLFVAGCSMGEVFESNTPAPVALQFNPMLGPSQTATRAGESDNSTLQIASEAGVKPPHIVIHTYTGTPGSSLTRYFSDELGYFNSGNYWNVNSSEVRFLPQGGMNLYAFFATDFAAKGKLTDVEYSHPTTATDYPKLTYTVDKSDALQQLDLIAAKVENITYTDIAIPFRHILSQVNFGVKGIDRHQIMVKNIRISNVYGKGTFDYQSWSWAPVNSIVHTYPYFFPDRNERSPDSGTGQNYRTQGTGDDSKNTYIFGDGGKFGPGDDNTFLYAQTDPATTCYATKANTSDRLHNSLMLLPQEIKANSNAAVTFDYEITVNGRVARSGTDCKVRLDAYHDWRPNLRYVYVFNFDDPSGHITFDVSINEWQNWDGPNGNGLKNGTIQEPTRTTLNAIGDDETIYLLGLLERNLTWDWSNGTQYTFNHLNVLTLDFSGVETRGYSVEIKVPSGFTLQKNEGKYTLTRNTKILLEPTEKQLNERKNGSSLALYGASESNLEWNWSRTAFASLKKNESFTLNFTNVSFGVEKYITLSLPTGVVASGTNLLGNNPYTINSTTSSVTITNLRVDSVQAPSKSILDVVSDHTEIDVNGGNVKSTGDTWNWSTYTFPNLDPQESFNILFAEVTFGEQSIRISLPAGFRAYTNATSDKLNPYQVTANSTVIIKNNKINYPTYTHIDALSNGSVIALAGEKLSGDADLDWSSFSFPNLPPQGAFTLDVNGIDFFNNQLTLKLPPHFVLSAPTGVNGSNPYTLNSQTTIMIRNDKIQKPSDSQLNLAVNGSVITMAGGKLFANETWDWSTLPFIFLGRSGAAFTLRMSNITLTPYTLDIKLPPNVVASGGAVSSQGGNVYRITSGTGDVTITDNRIIAPTATELNQIVQGGNISINGGVANLQQDDIWDLQTVGFTSLGGPGHSFTLNVSGITFNERSIELRLPNGFTASGGNVVYSSFGVYRIHNTGTITIKDSRRSVTGGNPLLTDVKARERIVLTGSVNENQGWTWAQMPSLAEGEWFEIDYSQTDAGGANALYLPTDGATYNCTGSVVYSWGVLFYQPTANNGIVRFTKITQYAFPALGDTNPNTGDTLTLPIGTMYGPYTWSWGKWLATGGNTFYSIDFSQISFVRSITVLLPTGYAATATGSGCIINGTTLTISGSCVVTVRNNNP